MPNNYAPVIDANGISADDFPTTLAKLTQDYQAIYGADAYLGNDSQDGQFVGVIAKAINDQSNSCVATYNGFSPATAQGAGLSSNVKINGLQREIPSFSTVPAAVVGQADITITNGQIKDAAGNLWALPTSVAVPSSGTIGVTLTCLTAGAIALGSGVALQIATPVAGWQTVTTTAAASPGAPVETDAALRVRQSQSTDAPAITIFDSILSDILNLPGVTRAMGYENNTTTTNGDGIPAGQCAFVVEGGSPSAIFAAIALKYPPGSGCYGTSSTTVVSAGGISKLVAYSVATSDTFAVALTLSHKAGWSTAAEPYIQAAVAAFLNAVPIGTTVSFFDVADAAKNVPAQYVGTFSVTAMTLTKNSGSAVSADVTIAWNEAAVCNPTAVTFS